MPAAVECQGILEQSWKAIQPAFLRLRIAPARLERNYLGQLGSDFIAKVARSYALATTSLSLSREESPPGSETCAINRRRSARGPRSTPVAGRSRDPERARRRLLPVRADRVLASLSGEWINVAADGRTNATWTFLTGARLQSASERQGIESEETFGVTLPARHRMTLERAGGKQDIAIFRSRDALYVSRGLSYDVVPLVDRTRLMVPHETSYVFFGPDGYEVITDNGTVLPASCGFERRPDGAELFAVRYSGAHGTRDLR